jgi:hypothetical protein
MNSPKVIIAAMLCAGALSACVVAPVQPYGYGYGPEGEAVVTDVAPPAPYVETVPVAPFAGAIWIGGYWGFRGGRHVWVPGRYEAPRPGYRWEPHRWVQHSGHWHLEGGAWRRG